ncbi:MAG: hypothetical protein Q8M76_08115, partial [Spirochaetaceae bacterium]|nr:hypothetical protein [Spirochaetaceae bacterium]
MKRLVQAIFLLVCAAAIGIALYYLIRERAGAAAAARPIAERHVVVSPEEEKADPRASQDDRDSSVNRIAALPNEVVLDVATFNFDQDEGEEQILTVRKTDRKDGRLSIVLADYFPQRHGWARSWEGETLTTKPTTFALQAKDMVGDHVLDIVCTGMDDAGQQTISIFKREQGEGPLTYATACAI